jgi:hypothetical protein
MKLIWILTIALWAAGVIVGFWNHGLAMALYAFPAGYAAGTAIFHLHAGDS